jgi:DNA mismatch endonuclease (patch repair protein)
MGFQEAGHSPNFGKALVVDPKRSALMSRIRSSNTQPELVVRRLLHAMGFRFRLHRRDLPGQPDLVLPRHKLVIFVHGCFWHQHPGCGLASSPKSRQNYWGPKLTATVERDRRNAGHLREIGWRVETIWECDTRKAERLAARVAEIVEGLPTAARRRCCAKATLGAEDGALARNH